MALVIPLTPTALRWPLTRYPEDAHWRSAGRYAATNVALRALRWPLCGDKCGAKGAPLAADAVSKKTRTGAPLAAMRRQRWRYGRSAGRYARNESTLVCFTGR
ncbi:uncharacterized protein LOC133839629 [Drosophila sulfurigaster albostrigata]|uniref:uncharacterized protein LOC133839629 n=1 Tax=Drosophila sulfurigaster albostrigata TaxID=89887 RepID=UPI002D21E972|nr:uncharacterized protein LOC133839629 [Drosophila sulfurigaster albostrigata]